MNLDDQLQTALARLENGEAPAASAAELPADDAELLEVAVRLRTLSYPVQSAASIAAQRAHLLQAAGKQRSAPRLFNRAMIFLQGWRTMLTTLPRPTKLVALGATLVALIVVVLLLQPTLPTANPNSTTGRYTQFMPVVNSAQIMAAGDPQHAVVAEAHGLVEMQLASGQWTPIKPGQALTASQHVRTRDLSSATLIFFDGSQAKLNAATEVVIEQLDAATNGPRTILLAQLSGTTDHQVTHSADAASRYEVQTPNGTSSAKGTVFHVSISPALITRVAVDEGIVLAVNVNVSVQVTAGQVTTILPDTPPAPPAFYLHGEGIVTQLGEVWRIGGLDFHTTATTVIIGNPQLGDRVMVDGHVVPDGTRVADVIVLLSRTPENRFEFSGPVGAIGDAAWTIAGRVVQIDHNTHFDANIHVGDLVKADGVIEPDGTLLAKNIRLLTTNTLSFEFTGLVQQIGSTSWKISNLTVAVNVSTTIESGLAVGDVVNVTGHIQTDGTWLADTIMRVEGVVRRFEVSGVVESLNPWRVSGISFATNDATEIDAGIKLDDRVQVSGRILDDGTWLAEKIKLLTQQNLTFDFVGEVTRLNPWVVSGISITVNSTTQIDTGIKVGDMVRVTGQILPDGTLLADRITLLNPELGCTNVTVIVVGVNGNQVTLSNGQTITLTDSITVSGQLQSSAIIIIRICVRADGTPVIVSIVVIFTPTPTPTPTLLPTGTPVGTPASEPEEGKVTICHYPGGNKAKGHTLSVGRSAMPAHLAHGDKLGPCS